MWIYGTLDKKEKTMKKYREEFPDENIYIHNPTRRDPTTGKSNPQRYKYKYIYIWRALTPKGRVSKYFHAGLFHVYRDTNFYPLPKVPKGYTWTGPFLYGEYTTWGDK
jgi:hypothetical protein